MDIKPILRAGTAIQAAALVGENLKFVRKKKKRALDFSRLAVDNIVGTSLLKSQSDFLEGI